MGRRVFFRLRADTLARGLNSGGEAARWPAIPAPEARTFSVRLPLVVKLVICVKGLICRLWIHRGFRISPKDAASHAQGRH